MKLIFTLLSVFAIQQSASHTLLRGKTADPVLSAGVGVAIDSGGVPGVGIGIREGAAVGNASAASGMPTAPAPAPAPAVKLTDTALDSIVGGSGGESGGPVYYTQAWAGENAGDTKRGSGKCTAFRRTLECNPSGPREPQQDKGCAYVVTSGESGYCECGDYAQFAAVSCDHRPFTCDVMCLKFAVVTKRQAYFHGLKLGPVAAQTMLNKVMWANQTDLDAMRIMSEDLNAFMGKALKHTNDLAVKAVKSMHKFMDMMKTAQQKDAAAADKEMAEYKEMIKKGPWAGIFESGQKQIDAGRAIQAKVREILPFDPQGMHHGSTHYQGTHDLISKS